MTITQTVEIPVDIATTADECPLCAKHHDPQTGELRFNAETIAGMKEVDDMVAGNIPAKFYIPH